MKKVFLFISIILLSISTKAQFKAVVGSIATEDGKDFYVVDISGKKAPELYKAVNSYINDKFKNSNAVMGKKENEMINLHELCEKAFICRAVLGKAIYANVDMNLTMYFKDDKIRFNIPVINSMKINGDKGEVKFSSGTSLLVEKDINMFKVNGEPKPVADAFNKFLNGTINDIIKYLKKSPDTNW
jgi:hypothetical protein